MKRYKVEDQSMATAVIPRLIEDQGGYWAKWHDAEEEINEAYKRGKKEARTVSNPPVDHGYRALQRRVESFDKTCCKIIESIIALEKNSKRIDDLEDELRRTCRRLETLASSI